MRQDINKMLSSEIYNLDDVTFNKIKISSANLAQLKSICKEYGFSSFLTESKNQVKLGKNYKELGLYTIGMSLSPYELGNHDFTVCFNATSSCKANCVIQNAGNPAYLPNKQKAMLKRKALLADDPKLFLAMFMRYIELKSLYCIKNNLALSIRFNISSDINYENIRIVYHDIETSFSDMAYELIRKTDTDVIPYDYTKNHDRLQNKNYHLVYSVSDSDISKSISAIKNGLSLAMVFDVDRNKPLPDSYQIGDYTLPVIDGDEHDYLPAYKDKLVIHGLRFKFKASDNKAKRRQVIDKAMLSGFVYPA